MTKTHRGLLVAFGLHIVRDGPISKDIGRLLQRAQELRHVADYRSDSVELADAQELITQTKTFLEAITAEYELTGDHSGEAGQ